MAKQWSSKAVSMPAPSLPYNYSPWQEVLILELGQQLGDRSISL